MKQDMNLTNQQLQEVYSEWNQGELSSYLLEITSHIFGKIDDRTGKALIDLILACRQTKRHRHVDFPNRAGIAGPHPHYRYRRDDP